MAYDRGLVDWAAEAMAPLGRVTHRAMMGGAVLYCGGVVFAMVADDRIWFKADPSSDAAWDAEGAVRFTYTMGEGRTGSLNYRAAPDDVYDDPDAFRRWAGLGLEAGGRAPVWRPRS